MLWLFLSYYIDMMSDPFFLRVKYIGLWWWEVERCCISCLRRMLMPRVRSFSCGTASWIFFNMAPRCKIFTPSLELFIVKLFTLCQCDLVLSFLNVDYYEYEYRQNPKKDHLFLWTHFSYLSFLLLFPEVGFPVWLPQRLQQETLQRIKDVLQSSQGIFQSM